MFAKYNDNLAATVLSIYLLGILAYIVQLIFMTEVWLKGEEIDRTIDFANEASVRQMIESLTNITYYKKKLIIL